MTDYEKLKNIIKEIPNLCVKGFNWYSPEIQAWHHKTARFLIHKFGERSYEYREFQKINFQAIVLDGFFDVKACNDGLNQAAAILSIYLDDLKEEQNRPEETLQLRKFDFSKVFIVHGHDGELKQSVARIIEKQGLEAIILSEQANQGRTIIEKFEDYSDVGGAICLFTADDIGKAKKEASDNSRARQNVVLETGYFMGKLGRSHVVILADSGIEMPSDLSGVVYTNTSNWQVDLLRDLKAMGYTVDLNKLF